MNSILIAFFLSLLAGLSTGIGSCIAFFTKRTNKKILSLSLGFSAGVMIYISFVEIFITAKTSIIEYCGIKKGEWITSLAFFSGIFLITLIDKFIPSFENPHEVKLVENMKTPQKNSLYKMGIFSAIAISIHNFPEGIATFMSGIDNPTLGTSVAIAIAIHNIPEGIAVSVPIFFATGSRKKAFIYSFLSGLSEPFGAVVAYFILLPYLNKLTLGITFAMVAGIMVFISLDELLPGAEKYGEHHLSIYGLISGMVLMSITLLLFV